MSGVGKRGVGYGNGLCWCGLGRCWVWAGVTVGSGRFWVLAGAMMGVAWAMLGVG